MRCLAFSVGRASKRRWPRSGSDSSLGGRETLRLSDPRVAALTLCVEVVARYAGQLH